jgi:hypothetical protein
VAALTQMYIHGVSTGKVKAISEELCGHSFSASAISEINKKLDAELGRFAMISALSRWPIVNQAVSLFPRHGRNEDWNRVSRKVAPSTLPCWIRWRKTMLKFGRWSLAKIG